MFCFWGVAAKGRGNGERGEAWEARGVGGWGAGGEGVAYWHCPILLAGQT